VPDLQTELYSIVGKRISELRKYHNDNQQQLASKVGLKRSTISNIESGRQQIGLHWMYRICQIYQCEIYVLLPKVEELASKVSLSIDDFSHIFHKQEVGDRTKKQILELLKEK